MPLGAAFCGLTVGFVKAGLPGCPGEGEAAIVGEATGTGDDAVVVGLVAVVLPSPPHPVATKAKPMVRAIHET